MDLANPAGRANLVAAAHTRHCHEDDPGPHNGASRYVGVPEPGSDGLEPGTNNSTTVDPGTGSTP